MIQSLFTPHLIFAELVHEFMLTSCICRSGGGFARYLVIS